jgi:acyl transferase domain-containing protein/acyl-CoA synthetase (AMP-forming)/AMP-acid ligase II/acyl carrier protein
MNRFPGVRPAPSTVVDLLRHRAQQQPDGLAYTFLVDGESDEVSLRYGELARRAQAIGALLQRRGAAQERVLLLYPPGLEYIAAFFGCLYAGAIAVPAYPPDPSRPTRTLPRLQAIVKNAQATIALTTTTVVSQAESVFAHDGSLKRIQLLATDGSLDVGPEDWREPFIDSQSLAFLMYTSGSTGTPKGVMVSHENVLHNVSTFPGFDRRPCRAFVSWLPFFHDLGLMFGLLHPLYQGTPSYLMSPLSFVQRPFRWLRAISHYQASATGGPNFAYDLCVRKTPPEERATLDLRSWNLALNGSEPVRRETLDRFVTAFEPCGFRREVFYPSYGLADSTATVSGGVELAPPVVQAIERKALEQHQVVEISDRHEGSLTLVGCGQSIADQRIVIVNPETLTPCAAGQVGEIWVSSPSVGQGYWNRPEDTERVFRARLAGTGEGPFLRTGDLGFVRDGELFISGRLKDVIIIWGSNHYPEDIEWTVEQCHPVLRPGCGAAFSVEVAQEERLVIVHEAELSNRSDVDEVIGNIRQAVTDTHGIEVSAVVLIKPGSLPKTSSGKIQRGACRAQFLAGTLAVLAQWRLDGENGAWATAPAHGHPSAKEQGSEGARERESRGALERSLTLPVLNPQSAIRNPQSEHAAAAITSWLTSYFSKRFKLDPGEIDVRQPFTRYGLASIDAVSLVRDLETWLARSLPPTLAWDYPSIEALANHLAGNPAILESHLRKTISPPATEPIAIVGIGCRFPGAPNVQAFWRLLAGGVDAISEVPPDRWDVNALYHPDPAMPGKMITRWGGFLEQVDQFDASFFGISPREAIHLDPRQRLMLEATWEALEDAGIPPQALSGSGTGVFIATLRNDYDILLFRDLTRVDAYSGPGTANSVVANRLSYFLDLRGPSVTLDTACSGSLVAIHLACQSLRSGESTLALAGGVNLNLLPDANVFFSKAGVLSPDGRCRTFDAGANGIVRSDGAGIVVLKPLSPAVADGDRIYAVIRGSAVNSDGRSNGLMAPNPQSQEAVLRAAYQQAGVSPDRVQYIEAHGTGTSLGDPIEVQALTAVLSSDRPAARQCALGSVKTNVGHMEAAAGVAGVIKVALSMRHRLIPPSLHFEEPNPFIAFPDSPLTVQQTLGPWPVESEPLIAGVSSFGLGGTNAHIVLEQAPQPIDGGWRMADGGLTKTGSSNPLSAIRHPPSAAPLLCSPYLLPLSARSPEALRALAGAYQQMLVQDESIPVFGSDSDSAISKQMLVQDESIPSLHDLCYTASVRRGHYEHRLGIVAHSREELVEQLRAFQQGESRSGVSVGRRPLTGPPKLAFVFSGQGSHWIGMGRELLEQEPVFRAALERCDQILRQYGEWSLLSVLTASPAESRLNETDIAQTAILALQVALAALWRTWGIVPDAVVGQSLGEVAAAHVAGAVSLEDALRVVLHRSRLMKTVAGKGKTAVVGLAVEQAELALTGFEDILSVAGSSSPTMTVVSGEPAALDRVLRSLKQRGIPAGLVQDVDVAFHSPQMEPLKAELVRALEGLHPRATSIPMISTVTGAVIEGTELDALYWGRNLREPFRFTTAIKQLIDSSVEHYLEIGPHPVLLRAITEGLRHLGRDGAVLPSMRRGGPERVTMLTSLGTLYTQGRPVEWNKLFPAGGRCVSVPSYPWQRERYWFDQVKSREPVKPQTQLARNGDGTHPLLGQHWESAASSGEHFWEIDLSPSCPSYLSEHQIQGTVVFPGAGYVEMALAAAQEALGVRSCVLEDVVFHRALLLPEDQTRKVQLVLAPESAGKASFHIYGLSPGAGRQPDSWRLCASGKICYGTEVLPPVSHEISVQEIQRRCLQEMSSGEHYRILRRRGLQYGSDFQTVQRIRRRDGEAIGRLVLPPPLDLEANRYGIHPVLLDGGFQMVSATLPGATNGHADDETYVPVGVASLRIYEHGSDRVWCHVQLRAQDKRGSESDLSLLNEDGQVVIEVRGLRFRQLDRAAGPDQDTLGAYQCQWQLKEPLLVDEVDRQNQTDRGRWVILADGQGVGEALASLLKDRGETCTLVFPGEAYRFSEQKDRGWIDPTRAEDFRRLIDESAGTDQRHCRVVHLWGLEAASPEETSVEALQHAHTLGCGALLHLIQALARSGRQPLPRLWIVTRGAQPVETEAAQLAVTQSPLWGLARVIAREHPEFWGGIIDLEAGCPSGEISMLLAQIGHPDDEDQMAFRGQQRYVARLVRSRDVKTATSSPIRLRTDGSYLITGGLGGLGLRVARWMVERGARRLILMGRSEIPPRSAWSQVEATIPLGARIAAIEGLERLGASIYLASVDVADEAQISSFLQEYDRQGWPPIRGIVHAAGLLRDQLLLRMDPEALTAVLQPKIVGAWLLHRLCEAAPLDFFILFSSAASLLGPLGQGNYAAGNAFLDGLAHYRRARGLPALSINWGPWAEVGMAARLDLQHHAQRGMMALSPEQGLRALEQVMGHDLAQIAIMSANWTDLGQTFPAAERTPFIRELVQEQEETVSASTHGSTHGSTTESNFVKEVLLRADAAQRQSLLEPHLRALVSDVMGIDPSRLDSQQPLDLMGMDSIMAVELKNRIEASLGLPLPIIDIIQGFTIDWLASRLVEQLRENGHATPEQIGSDAGGERGQENFAGRQDGQRFS